MDEKKLKDEIKKEIIEELNKEEGEIFKNPAKTPGEKFVKGFDYAFEGLVYAISNEKNMKFHVLVSVLVLLASLFFNVSRVEMIFLTLSITFVICMELVNTAIEEVVNLASKGRYSKFAKTAKDVSAAATFVSALVSIFVAYLVFFDKFTNFSNSLFIRISRRPSHLAIITVSVVIIISIFFKGLFYKGKGTALHGGFVSGHASVSFCLATIGAMMTNGDIFIILIFYALAVIVAESRFEADIHSLPEIIRGAILGSLIAFLMFGAFL